eukprot:GGOE01021342.1.p2 GENE.GGOE01021342.1~~GGOE01021342.1.p2  ORF type:complete len:239 (-),score=65.77 GGOE01021342.1:230-910(-)
MKNELLVFASLLAVAVLCTWLPRSRVDAPTPAPTPQQGPDTGAPVDRPLQLVTGMVVTFPVKVKPVSGLQSQQPRRPRSHHHRKNANETVLVRNGTTTHMRSGNSAFSFGVDEWQMPSLNDLSQSATQQHTVGDLRQHPVNDFAGNPVSYASFPPLRLNPIGRRRYLVYIYVNCVAIEAALNLIVSLRRYDIQHVLLLCEDAKTAEVLHRVGLYHYFPNQAPPARG